MLYNHLLIQSFPESRRETRKKRRQAPASSAWSGGQGRQRHSAPSLVCTPRSLHLRVLYPNSPASLLPSYLATSFPICVLFLSLSRTHLESDPQLCFANRLWSRLITWLLSVTLIPSSIFHLALRSAFWCKCVKGKIIVYNREMCAADISELHSPFPRPRDGNKMSSWEKIY